MTLVIATGKEVRLAGFATAATPDHTVTREMDIHFYTQSCDVEVTVCVWRVNYRE